MNNQEANAPTREITVATQGICIGHVSEKAFGPATVRVATSIAGLSVDEVEQIESMVAGKEFGSALAAESALRDAHREVLARSLPSANAAIRSDIMREVAIIRKKIDSETLSQRDIKRAMKTIHDLASEINV